MHRPDPARRAQTRFVLFTKVYRKSPIATIRHAETFASFDRLPDLVATCCREV